MKVMHVVEAMERGGAETLVVEHVRHASPGTASAVLALNRGGPALDAAAAAGARTFLLGKRGGIGALGAIRDLARRMRAEGVQLVNGHNPTGALYATLAARLAGIPAVRTEHSLHYAGRHSALYPALEPLLTSLCARVICVCDAVRESHVARFPGQAARFVTVANGISDDPAPEREAARAALGLAADQRLVLAIGSLTPQKAHTDLIAAFARVAARDPAARLWIAGEGRLRGTLEAAIAASGVAPRIALLGARDDAARLLAACDVFVLPSVREGLSITLLEAMRAGRASIATRVGGNPEAIADGVSGTIVPMQDPEALTGALKALLDDPECRRAMGIEARARYESRFRAERMVRETESVYAGALSRRNAVAAPAGEVTT